MITAAAVQPKSYKLTARAILSRLEQFQRLMPDFQYSTWVTMLHFADHPQGLSKTDLQSITKNNGVSIRDTFAKLEKHGLIRAAACKPGTCGTIYVATDHLFAVLAVAKPQPQPTEATA